MTKGTTLTDQFGTRIELLSKLTKYGKASVKILEPGTMIERISKGDVIHGFFVTHGLTRFVEDE